MSDPELAQDILANIMTAITRIERRFAGIDSPDNFVLDDLYSVVCLSKFQLFNLDAKRLGHAAQGRLARACFRRFNLGKGRLRNIHTRGHFGLRQAKMFTPGAYRCQFAHDHTLGDFIGNPGFRFALQM